MYVNVKIYAYIDMHMYIFICTIYVYGKYGAAIRMLQQ